MKEDTLTRITLFLRRYSLTPAGIGMLLLLSGSMPASISGVLVFIVPILAAIGTLNEIIAVIHLQLYFYSVKVEITAQEELIKNKVKLSRYDMRYEHEGNIYTLRYANPSPFSSGAPSRLLISKTDPSRILIDMPVQKYLNLIATGGLLYLIFTIPAVLEAWHSLLPAVFHV